MCPLPPPNNEWDPLSISIFISKNSILIRLRPFYIHIYLMNGWINTIEYT